MSQAVDPTTIHNVEAWLSGNYDEKTKKAILHLKQEDPKKLAEAFYTKLDFGTGGLRGIMGVGTNRMNIYTVRGATQGLANYLKKISNKEKKNSVVIGFDSRHHSQEFAEETAKVLAANNIKVYLFQEIRPVAFVSFALLQKQCSAGIMITASHNPPQYNGYKVYWSYGGQVLPPHDQGIIEEVNKIQDFSTIKIAPIESELIEKIGEEVDKAYLQATSCLAHYPKENHNKGKQLQIVYTPLYGSGYAIVPKALYDWGFSNLTLVEKQSSPNGDFPSIKTPNPEDIDALKLGIKTLKEVSADLLIGTDADADRIGIVIQHNGEIVSFTGNEIGCMCAEHLCLALQQTGKMPPKPVFVKTIVTSELFRQIATHYKAACIDVLTGFKYIGEKIHQWEEEKKEADSVHLPYHHFIFGAEESYGYLLGTHVRDKDAIISANIICEMALHQKLQGKTLLDFLYEIYQKYGVYREKLISLTFEGKQGQEKINSIMQQLRSSAPKELGGVQIETIEDYLSRTLLHLLSGKKEPLLLPKSDVLRFWLSDGTWLVIRPSGTEPKIKIYCGVHKSGILKEVSDIEKKIQEADTAADKMIKALQEHFYTISAKTAKGLI